MTARLTGTVGRLRATIDRTLPPGTLGVGAGLVVSGLTAYGFLAISARALGPARYAGISTLWALVFLAAPGLFLPVEQEVGRTLTARRAHQLGGRAVVLVAARLAGIGSIVVAGIALAASPVLVPRLFDGDAWLLGAFALSAPAYGLYYLTRGILAGGGRFPLYGGLVSVEGLARFVLAAVFAAAGVRVAAPYGFLMAIPCFVAVAVAAVASRGRHDPVMQPGPPATVSELSTSMGYLLAGSVLAQALVNAGPLAVRLLAAPGDSALAGVFLNGLVIARIPLFFFQAVQAALLPALSAHAALRRHDLFRSDLRRLVVAVGGIALLAVVANWAVGPFVVERVFGGAYRIGHADMALLAAASGSFMVALALAQGLIALHHHRDTVLTWLIGVLVFVGVTLVDGPTMVRVERGLLAGSLAALITMQVLLAGVSRRVWRAEAA